jgi:hypothetical protein
VKLAEDYGTASRWEFFFLPESSKRRVIPRWDDSGGICMDMELLAQSCRILSPSPVDIIKAIGKG